MNAVLDSVVLPNQIRLEYVEQGDPTSVPVVLLHGVTDSWRSFEPVFPHLPPTLHVFALTQRGHGDSARPPSGYRIADFAADVAAFLDALDLGSAVMVGTSMGNSVAQRFAIDHPERTRGLVLMGAFVNYRDNPAVVEIEPAFADLEDPIAPDFVREFQESTLAQPVPPAFLETVIEESLKVPARVWREAFAGFLEIDHLAEIDRIAAPTLVVWGDQDLFAPRSDQEILVTAIAGSRLSVYAGAGHALHWEEPARFAADLASFVAGLAR